MSTSSSYVPDDSRIALSSLEFLRSAEGEKLRTEIAPLPTDLSVSQIAALRKHYPVDHLHAALALAKLQPKAQEKFPFSNYFWSTPEALQQSTSSRVAAHKAARFAAAGAIRIIDFCAGIGGDALALAQIAPTFAIDQSEIRLTCLRYNAEDHPPSHPLRTITGKIENILAAHSPLPKEAFIHIDPSRRTGGKRSAKYEDLIPPPAILEKLFALYPNAALKLSPAVDFESLPDGHLELISENSAVVQAILWREKFTEQFSPHTRTATVLSEKNPPFTFTAPPAQADGLTSASSVESQSVDSLPKYIYELDGSLTRAQLAAPFARANNLSPLTPDAGYLLGENLLTHPALTPFHLHAILPYSEKNLPAALEKIPAPPGPIEIKSRNAPNLDSDQLQRHWSKKINRKITLLLFRQSSQLLAALATRPP